MQLTRFLIPLLTLALLAGCAKDEVLVHDNVPPPDGTIPTLVLENYVTKAYIALLGRKPSQAEENQAVTDLRTGNLNNASRIAMLSGIMANAEYRLKVLEFNSFKLLNGFDTAAVTEQIYQYEQLLSNPTYQEYWPYLQAEKDRMVELKNAQLGFIDGTVSAKNLRRALTYNNFYDQINMGTENFVVSTFNHFLYRNPTQAELENGKMMVDQIEGVLFGQVGTSKVHYLNALIASNDYHAGQVRELFVRYLFRVPTSEESAHFTGIYRNSGNFDQLQREILSLDEYIGL